MAHVSQLKPVELALTVHRNSAWDKAQVAVGGKQAFSSLVSV